jgi:hypothetical protein
MKASALLTLAAAAAPAAAFMPTTNIVAPKAQTSLKMQFGDRSTAIPGTKQPEGLDGVTWAGDVGFDP